MSNVYSDTFQIGDRVTAAIPQRSGSVWTITGTITASRTMKATGQTFYAINRKSGIRPEWITKA